MINERQESWYRKWMNVSKQSKITPLVINFAHDKLVISVDGLVLLGLTRDQFSALPSDEIVKMLETSHEIRSNNNDSS